MKIKFKAIVIIIFGCILITSCGLDGLFSPSDSTENKLRSRIDSISINDEKLIYDYADPSIFEFYPKGETDYTFYRANENSAGGMGPNYSHYDYSYKIKRDDSMVTVKDIQTGYVQEYDYFSTVNYRYAVLKYGSSSNRMVNPFKPLNDSILFVQFTDIDSERIAIVTEDLNHVQVFKENVGLVYYRCNNGYSMNSDFVECLLTKINGTDFAADTLIARLRVITNKFRDSINASSSLQLILENNIYDSVIWKSSPHKDVYTFVHDTVATVDWEYNEYLSFFGSDTTFNIYNKLHESYDTIYVRKDSLYMVKKADFPDFLL